MYIGIEDLAANALIELADKKGIKAVTFKKLEEYGAAVVNAVNDSEDPLRMKLSRNLTDQFFTDYQKYFKETLIGKEEGVELRDNVVTDSLVEKFRGFLPLNVLFAFTKEDCINVLLCNAVQAPVKNKDDAIRRDYKNERLLKEKMEKLPMEELIKLEDYFVSISGSDYLVFKDGVPFHKFYKDDAKGYAYSIWLGIVDEDQYDKVFSDCYKYVENILTRAKNAD